jgi:hypothetical protein
MKMNVNNFIFSFVVHTKIIAINNNKASAVIIKEEAIF